MELDNTLIPTLALLISACQPSIHQENASTPRAESSGAVHLERDCAVLCSRVATCMAEGSELAADSGLRSLRVAACEEQCGNAAEGHPRVITQLAACDEKSSCADFFACMAAIRPGGPSCPGGAFGGEPRDSMEALSACEIATKGS